MAEAYSLPFARINPKLSDPKVIDVLPEDFLEKQCVLPLFLMKGTLALAVHEPTNVFVREEARWKMVHHQAGPTGRPTLEQDDEGGVIH